VRRRRGSWGPDGVMVRGQDETDPPRSDAFGRTACRGRCQGRFVRRPRNSRASRANLEGPPRPVAAQNAETFEAPLSPRVHVCPLPSRPLRRRHGLIPASFPLLSPSPRAPTLNPLADSSSLSWPTTKGPELPRKVRVSRVLAAGGGISLGSSWDQWLIPEVRSSGLPPAAAGNPPRPRSACVRAARLYV